MKKLNLKKKVISVLTDSEKGAIKGGGVGPALPYTYTQSVMICIDPMGPPELTRAIGCEIPVLTKDCDPIQP
ncbi:MULTISPECIES: class I lanthipeptide [Flavobacterium]|uniref:class I lanthipeptide n=1 Tax=Flavobacterium TaxID=237 RepID=UPI000869347A|nr:MULTISPECIES: class I lanthipeptide [Flavobacterium]MBN9285489.1 class I lanthipeptide [Flavobacterium sp.]ODS82787.1 MAG: hypothetical protein ABS44_18035 [Chryseobacterium sp. SCN 40-13]OJV71479.1 MAG: hypothetical protein BGO42_06390 [Flavobacterium sp. 40-81]